MLILVIIHDTIYTKNTSTPVEEMYHRQLVITLDSILDARFSNNDTIKIVPYSQKRLMSAEKFIDMEE